MPSVYRQLLACIDLSPLSGHVLARARELAAREAEGLKVLHVVDHRPLPDLDYGLGTLPGFEMDLESAMESARSRLDRLLAEQGMGGLDHEVVAGIPQTEIIRTAEELPADLIILGSTDRTGLGRLLGSTAHSVLNHAPCDVLAVRVAPGHDKDDRA